MTIKDSQRSHCVELIAELGEASGEARRKLSVELDKICGEATSQPLRGYVELRVKLTFCEVN